MARARNIKPSIMENEDLAELPPLHRLLFIYLWMLADRDGRLEDRPKRIAGRALPYDRDADADQMLHDLAARGFIQRYNVASSALIQIVNFNKHQTPHPRETASELPSPEEGKTKDMPRQDQGNAKEVSSPSDVLIPDTPYLIPDTGCSDSLIPDTPILGKTLQQASPPAGKKPRPDAEDSTLQAVCRETWGSYGHAYQTRYGTAPIRNAKISAQLRQFCQRVPQDEAPHIAAFYVRNNALFYVTKGHPIGSLVADAEKLRTEWVTQKTITHTQARQADKTQATGNVFNEIIAEIEAREHLNVIN